MTRNHAFIAARDALTSRPETVFYTNIVTVAAMLCSGFLGVTFGIFGILLLRLPIDVAAALCLPLLPVIGLGVFVEIALAIFLSRAYPVRISDAGVSATDFWGKKMTLSWGEIETVTPTKLLSLPYLKVASFRKDRPVMWLPMFVGRPALYREAIRNAASPANPLRRYIEEIPTQRQPLTG